MQGNHVVVVSVKEGEVAQNKRLFNGCLGIPENRLQFLVHNLYDVEALGRKFDEIIYTEVLEHDQEICRKFFEILNLGGATSLLPNAAHRDHQT